jgi:hypothetical protein
MESQTNPVALLALITIACLGWGRTLEWLLRGHGRVKNERLTLGLGLVLTLSSCLAAVGAYSEQTVLIFLALGACFVLARFRTHQIAEVGQTLRTMSATHFAALGVITLLILFWIYLPPSFNDADDGPGYAAIIAKLSTLGGWAEEPFSERRMFSLMIHVPFQSFVVDYCGFRFLSVVEPVLGCLLIGSLVVPTIAAKREGAAGALGVAAFLAIVNALPLAGMAERTVGSSVTPNLAPVFLPAAFLIVVLLHSLNRDDTDGKLSGSAELLIPAFASGIAIALRPTVLPITLLCLAIVCVPRRVLGRVELVCFLKRMLIAASILSGTLAPLMYAQWRASGTPFFPFLGRGWHGTAYGTIPTINSLIANRDHLLNVLLIAAFDPCMWVVAGLSAIVFRAKANDARRWRFATVGFFYLVNYAAIVYGTSGVSSTRYTFPLSLSAALVFLIEAYGPLETSATRAYAQVRHLGYRQRRRLGAALITGAFVAVVVASTAGYFERSQVWIKGQFARRLSAWQPSVEEVTIYRGIQNAIPERSKALVFLPKAYLLDFRRNQIMINDQPWTAGPPPGWPMTGSAQATASYLRSNGIEFVLAAKAPSPKPPNSNSAGANRWFDLLNSLRSRFDAVLADSEWRQSRILEQDGILVYRVPGPRRP